MPSVLTVDDSPSMRQMVSFTLRRAGYEVLEAGDGVEALETARRQPVDVVLTDVNMPRMNGIELVRALRELSTYRFTPILLLTTEDGAERKQEGRAVGATGWIVKPFDPDSLLATVGRVLG